MDEASWLGTKQGWILSHGYASLHRCALPHTQFEGLRDGIVDHATIIDTIVIKIDFGMQRN